MTIYQVQEPYKGDLSNEGTSEGFAEDPHKDERGEGVASTLVGSARKEVALMKRILLLATVTALLAVMLVVGVTSAFAHDVSLRP